jgi:hypothetical protein
MLNLVFYTNRFIPSRFTAYTFGFVVFVRPKAKDNEALLQHELTHVRQFWRNPLSGLLGMVSKKIRMRHEVEAYRVQLTYSPCKENRDNYVEAFAGYLSTNYNLDISVDEARKLLTE